MPPELTQALESEELEGGALSGKIDLMRKLFFAGQHSSVQNPMTNKQLVALVLEHARRVIAHPSRPMIQRTETFLREPFGEITIEDSLEEDPTLLDPGQFLVTVNEEKPFSCVAMLDTSSSMSGDKHLLASVAVAVLLLEVEPKDASVIVFNSDATAIKELRSDDPPEKTVLSFLRTKPRGFTNIASGLELGLRQLKRFGSQKRKVGLIATDGRTTEGKDPIDIAREFDSLIVLHLHGPGSHIDASREMAQAGHGVCLEVEKFEELPKRLYDAVRLLARL